MTVSDLIAHLQTLPQDLEVWSVWDESGEYTPAAEPPGRIDTIVYGPVYGGKCWGIEADYDDPALPRKNVVVLLPKLSPIIKEK